jgi:pimeloyl-ACP methyl ester carboxylesterase
LAHDLHCVYRRKRTFFRSIAPIVAYPDRQAQPVRQSQKEAAAKLRPISAPTLVIWGEQDAYLGFELAEPHREDVPNLERVERLADASHWVHHDEPERVNQLLIDFFAPAVA